MTTSANPTILLNSTNPAPPANGINVKPQAAGGDPNPVSFYLPCPGGTATFLRADGTFAVPPGSNVMTTAGDMIYENATPVPARLPIGSNGQVLTVVSGLPAWAPATTTTPYEVKVTASVLANIGVSWLNTAAGGAFTLAAGANKGDRKSILISNGSIGVGNTWTVTFPSDFHNNGTGTLTFTSASITTAQQGTCELIYANNGWEVVSLQGGTLS